MKKNSLNKIVLFKKRVFKKRINTFFLKRLGKIYLINKSSFLLNKFTFNLFKFYMSFFKKLKFFIKRNMNFYITFKKFFFFKNFFYGNVEKLSVGYVKSDMDCNFYRFVKKNYFFSTNNNLIWKNSQYFLYGVVFFSINNSLINLDDENDDFFYKNSIYETMIYNLENDFYLSFTKLFDFDYVFDYNFLFILEIYKINILLILFKIK